MVHPIGMLSSLCFVFTERASRWDAVIPVFRFYRARIPMGCCHPCVSFLPSAHPDGMLSSLYFVFYRVRIPSGCCHPSVSILPRAHPIGMLSSQCFVFTERASQWDAVVPVFRFLPSVASHRDAVVPVFLFSRARIPSGCNYVQLIP